MSDSNEPETLDAKHEHDREKRIQAIKRWVEYIRAEPPETWGPQQNAVVNDQLTAAQSVETTATHQQYVTEVANEIIDERDGASEDAK